MIWIANIGEECKDDQMTILMLTYERSVSSPLFLRTDPTGFFRLLLTEDKIKKF